MAANDRSAVLGRLHVVAAAWFLACVVLGTVAALQVLQLRDGVDAIDDAGKGLRGTGESLTALDQVPLVGDDIADAGDRIERGGETVRAGARDLRADVVALAALVGLSIAILPSVPMLTLLWVARAIVPRQP